MPGIDDDAPVNQLRRIKYDAHDSPHGSSSVPFPSLWPPPF
jgi:hypothetical protein